MALISCNECGKQISDKAATCPGCGAPVQADAQPPAAASADKSAEFEADLAASAARKKKLVIGIGAAAVVVGCVALFFIVGGSGPRQSISAIEACKDLALERCKGDRSEAEGFSGEEGVVYFTVFSTTEELQKEMISRSRDWTAMGIKSATNERLRLLITVNQARVTDPGLGDRVTRYVEGL